ncbi:hypothetical protein OG518_29730 [Streptomyces sp. NBC_01397]|nr:hypothetical protein OG518_29730 [Streptomyces sp. NBC_01397]
MPLAVVAIIVSGLSALFTASNMIVSLATYRRARPRIEVNPSWLLIGAEDWEDDAMGFFTIHLANRGQNAVKLQSLYLNLELGPQDVIAPAKNYFTDLTVIDGDIDEEISGFNGRELTMEANNLMSDVVPHITRARIVAVLADGSKVASRWMAKDSRLVVLKEQVLEMAEAYAIANLGWTATPTQQLSFDDLEEME